MFRKATKECDRSDRVGHLASHLLECSQQRGASVQSFLVIDEGHFSQGLICSLSAHEMCVEFATEMLAGYALNRGADKLSTTEHASANRFCCSPR